MAVATVVITHAFEENCGGKGGRSVDFAALAAPSFFAFHLAMGVRLVGSVLSQFGSGGGGQGGTPQSRGQGTMAREATMAVAQTDGRGSDGDAKDSGGNGAALSAISLFARATTSWRRGGRRCLGIVGHPTLIGVMLSQRWGGLQYLVILGIPLLTGATTSWQQGRQQCLGIVGCSLARSCNGGSGGRTTVACFCAGGGGGADESALALFYNGGGGEADNHVSGELALPRLLTDGEDGGSAD